MIRPATPDDVSVLQDLWREFFAEIPDLPYRDDDLDEELQEIADAVGSGIVLVAEQDGAAVGLATGRKTGTKVVELRDLYVQPAARRSGLAAELVSEFVARAKEGGAEVIELDVLASNTGARGVYERWGFQPVELTLAAPVAELEQRLQPGGEEPTVGFVHVQTDDVDKVGRDAAKVLHRETEVTPGDGWTRVDAKPEELRNLARELSFTAGVSVALSLEAGAVVRYVLFDRGSMVDEYLSVPEYFGPLPPGDVMALGANPTVVARLTNADPARVRAVARTALSPSELPPAQELYEQIAGVLGVTL